MTMPSGTGQPDTTLTRDLLYAARYYLGRPRSWMVLAAVAVVTGLVFNWNWLVAAGLAPILLSILPCVIMCGFGVCMMCRSAKDHSVPARNSTSAPTPPAVAVDQPVPLANAGGSVPLVTQSTAATVSAMAAQPAEGLSCCHGPEETTSNATTNPQPTEERKAPHA